MSYKNVETELFINPYNFVSANWNKTEKMGIETHLGQERISGFFDCELKTVTPLAIPSFEKEDEKGHKKFAFMRDPKDHVPMIPGSSLRGCIRTVYETLSDSCLVTAAENTQFTKRASMGESGKPGLLIREEDGWKLYDAKRYLIIIEDKRYKPFDNQPDFRAAKRIKRDELEGKYQYGQKVFFCEQSEYKSKKGFSVGTVVQSFSDSRDSKNSEEGYLYIGEVPPEKNGKAQSRKHFESIFQKGNPVNGVRISRDEIEGLKTIFHMYNDPGINRNISKDSRKCYKGVDDLLEKDKPGTVIPIWYKKDTHTLSLAAIGRIVYKKRMHNFIDTKKPCDKRNDLCKACALFGMSSKNEGMGSRVRITDAKMTEPDYKGEYVTLKELGSPRTSYIPFYANSNRSGSLLSSYDEEGIFLRGRKFYWHNTQDRAYEVDPKLAEEKRKTERNASMELAEKNSVFRFRVYFDEISRAQYDELKWTLTLGENDPNGHFCYKIGHGKPIGLGSAKITIVKESIRSVDLASDHPYELKVNEKLEVGNPFDVDEDRSELLTILDVRSTEGKRVSYPYITNPEAGGENDTASHKWFSDNWDLRKGKPEQKLPNPIIAKDTLLKAKEYINDKGDSLPSNEHRNVQYQVGQIYEGIVTGYNNTGKFAQVKLECGGKADFYDEAHKWDGCHVKVKYLGKKPDKNGHLRDKWERV